MKKSNIEIGKVYSAKLRGSYLPVQVIGRIPGGRFKVRNLADAKSQPFTLKQDLLRGDGETHSAWEARRGPEPVAATTAPGGAGAKTGDQPAKDAKSARKRATGQPSATSRGPSGLDAAATVLAEAGEPLNTKTMVERMLAKGLWTTGGKTPAATIYAAIIREISVRKDAARFRKAERGKFELAK